MVVKFITGRIKGILYSLKGGIELLRTEPSIQVQFVMAILVTIAGFYLVFIKKIYQMFGKWKTKLG